MAHVDFTLLIPLRADSQAHAPAKSDGKRSLRVGFETLLRETRLDSGPLDSIIGRHRWERRESEKQEPGIRNQESDSPRMQQALTRSAAAQHHRAATRFIRHASTSPDSRFAVPEMSQIELLDSGIVIESYRKVDKPNGDERSGYQDAENEPNEFVAPATAVISAEEPHSRLAPI